MDKFTERLIIEKLRGKRLSPEELDNIASQIKHYLNSGYKHVFMMSDLMSAIDTYIKRYPYSKLHAESLCALNNLKAHYKYYRRVFGYEQL